MEDMWPSWDSNLFPGFAVKHSTDYTMDIREVFGREKKLNALFTAVSMKYHIPNISQYNIKSH